MDRASPAVTTHSRKLLFSGAGKVFDVLPHKSGDGDRGRRREEREMMGLVEKGFGIGLSLGVRGILGIVQ